MKRFIIEHRARGLYVGIIGGRPKFRHSITRSDNDVSVFLTKAQAKAELVSLPKGCYILAGSYGKWEVVP